MLFPDHFTGIYEVTRDFPSGSCNRKLVGACHFAASAITRGIFNASQDYASPFDGDGHGRVVLHTTSIAARNHGISVTVTGDDGGLVVCGGGGGCGWWFAAVVDRVVVAAVLCSDGEESKEFQKLSLIDVPQVPK
ncbi:hypothetical protein Tco_1528811, partial [Tanacetum coccineum]